MKANLEYHQPEILGALAGFSRRFGSVRMHEAMQDDFMLAAAQIEDMSRAVAVECMTGQGSQIPKFFEVGFRRVIGVDISEREIAVACKRFTEEQRVQFFVQEISAFFQSRPGPYDFIFLGSLHHIEDYLSLINLAGDCINVGGVLYVLDSRKLGILGQLMRKTDEHLFTLLSSPKLWCTRVLTRLGLVVGASGKAWQLARKAEIHASSGIDEVAVCQLLTKSGFSILRHIQESCPCTRVFWVLNRVLFQQTSFRLIAVKMHAM
jgi:SAM-dependent methyltransferase